MKNLIEKFNAKYPLVLRGNAVTWWLYNKERRVNSSFFNKDFTSLEKRRVLADLINAKKYFSFIRCVRGVK